MWSSHDKIHKNSKQVLKQFKDILTEYFFKII
jgi:hypothetical protein